MLQTKGLNAVNRKQFRQALLDKGTTLIDANSEYISPDVILTRPSVKVVWNGTDFVEVPVNEPAWHVDYVTGEKMLLVEGEATNLFPKSNDLTVLNRPDCRFEYDAIDKCTAVYYADNIATSVSVLPEVFDPSSPFVLTFDFKFNTDFSGHTGSIQFGGATGIESDRWAVQFNTDFTHQNFGDDVISPYVTKELADGWTRVELYAGYSEGNTRTRGMKIRGRGDLTDTSISTPFIYFRNVNVIQGTVASSPIITTGTSVRRAADTITYMGEPTATTQLLATDRDFVSVNNSLMRLQASDVYINKLVNLSIEMTATATDRFDSEEAENIRRECMSLHDPHWENVISLLHFNGSMTDETGRYWEQGDLQEYVDGVFNKGLKVSPTDTSDTYTSGADLIFDTTTDFTIEFFFRMDTFMGNYSRIFGIVGDASTLTEITAFVRPDSLVGFELTSQNGNKFAIKSTTTVEEGQWYHIACVNKNKNISLFVDGVREQVSPATLLGTYGSIGTLTIGILRSASDLLGVVDEFRLTKGVARYTEDFTPPTEPFANH